MPRNSNVEPVRDSNGRFKLWPGGRSIKDYSPKWQNNNQHGISIHIGQVFSRQHNRRPKVGDVVRTKNKDGTYHRGALWYVRTRYGWRVTTSTTHPSAATIRRICDRARPTRRK